MIVNSFSCNSFGITAMVKFCQCKTAQMLQIKSFLNILLMKFRGSISNKSL